MAVEVISKEEFRSRFPQHASPEGRALIVDDKIVWVDWYEYEDWSAVADPLIEVIVRLVAERDGLRKQLRKTDQELTEALARERHRAAADYG